MMVGKRRVKHWDKTQATISLSSGESELHDIASGCTQALGVQSPMHDTGLTMPITLHNDHTAAVGIARCKGLGKDPYVLCQGKVGGTSPRTRRRVRTVIALDSGIIPGRKIPTGQGAAGAYQPSAAVECLVYGARASDLNRFR